jgi:XTP/dITP diphosphohydrolase
MKHSRALAPLKELVIATANPGKLREFQALLSGLPFAPVAQATLGIAAPEETGATFAENALIKARHAAVASGAAAIADDSGLEVDALGGAPGIYSARYASERAGDASAGNAAAMDAAAMDAAAMDAAAMDAANNAKLIAALAGVPFEARRARYRCALVYLDGPKDPAPLFAHGVWEGYVLEAPRGAGGFGYDPYFWLPELAVTAAELDPEQKNRLSHRATALRALRSALDERVR